MSMLKIGCAQVPQTADIKTNVTKAIEYIEKADAGEVELLCFPETHLAGYRVGVLTPDAPVDTDGLQRAIDTLRDECRKHSMGIIMGTETPNPGGKPYNSAHVLDKNGETLCIHHKSRITALDSKGYERGPGPTPFTFKGVPMGLVICYEGYRFPEATRELARGGAKVVFHPQCSTTLPNMEWKTPVLESLIVTRGAETTMYFISTNLSGKYSNSRSLVIKPDGIIEAASEMGKEMLIVADIYPNLATHAFLEDDPEKIFKASGEYDAVKGS
ncbi:carbon-nitrogen hydrolase family protein [Candidatus Latescibacterota bacterium]